MIFVSKNQFCFLFVFLFTLLGYGVSVQAVERELYLETDCIAAGYVMAPDPGENCFEDLDALNTFLWYSGNNPTETDPAIVNVGLGKFTGQGTYSYTFVPFVGVVITADGALECAGTNGNNGWTTFRGKSRNLSILSATATGTESHTNTSLVFSADDCDGIAFDNLSFKDNGVGIHWSNGGNSVFSDVDIDSRLHAWAEDANACSSVEGEHYFYGSKLSSNYNTYYAGCTRTWFYGGEMLTILNDTFNNSVAGHSTVQASNVADVRIFGSAVRMNAKNHTAGGSVNVVLANGAGSEIHMHGGILNGTAEGASEDIIGIRADNGLVHIVDTAWVLKADSSNTVTRVSALPAATVQSPFLWQSGGEPPVPSSNSFTSVTGKDIYVENDCDSTDCTGGDEPHIMVYSSACTGAGGPWFNTVTGACRVN